MTRRDDVVAASEIAAWTWCPESWRLDSLELTRDDNGLLRGGEWFHDEKAVFEKRSRSAVAVGRRLIALAILMALVALVLMWGS